MPTGRQWRLGIEPSTIRLGVEHPPNLSSLYPAPIMLTMNKKNSHIHYKQPMSFPLSNQIIENEWIALMIRKPYEATVKNTRYE